MEKKTVITVFSQNVRRPLNLKLADLQIHKTSSDISPHSHTHPHTHTHTHTHDRAYTDRFRFSLHK